MSKRLENCLLCCGRSASQCKSHSNCDRDCRPPELRGVSCLEIAKNVEDFISSDRVIQNRRGQVMISKMKRHIAIPIVAIMVAGLFGSTASRADDASARRILKAMSDYVTAQKTLSITYDADIEVITNDLQKIQFTNSGQVVLSRPDKLRARRTGGYADVQLVFDGKALSIFSLDDDMYTQVEAPGSVDQLIGKLRAEFTVDMPGADLLLSNVYDGLIEDVLDAKHIGRGVIDGVECEHLAFRNSETDWQIWVELGDRPIPRKYVITSKGVTAAPQYTLRIKEWRTDTPVADAFAFNPPPTAKRVSAEQLAHIDEVPNGVAIGGKK